MQRLIFWGQRGCWGHWGHCCYHVCWGHWGHWGFQNHSSPWNQYAIGWNHLILMFWKKIFLKRMMEFQVKFCHHSGLRLWRTGMLFSTKSKVHKSKFRISWMYRCSFYDLKVHFWWPNKHLFWFKSSSNTLYEKEVQIIDSQSSALYSRFELLKKSTIQRQTTGT